MRPWRGQYVGSLWLPCLAHSPRGVVRCRTKNHHALPTLSSGESAVPIPHCTEVRPVVAPCGHTTARGLCGGPWVCCQMPVTSRTRPHEAISMRHQISTKVGPGAGEAPATRCAPPPTSTPQGSTRTRETRPRRATVAARRRRHRCGMGVADCAAEGWRRARTREYMHTRVVRVPNVRLRREARRR